MEEGPMVRAVAFVAFASLTSTSLALTLAPVTDWVFHRVGPMPAVLLAIALVGGAFAGPAFGQAWAMARWFPNEARVFDDEEQIRRFRFLNWRPAHLTIVVFVADLARAPRSAGLLLFGGAVLVVTFVAYVQLLLLLSPPAVGT
ncbi:MAG: hypothetical protein AAF602_28570 [Myxococcota bacterium]